MNADESNTNRDLRWPRLFAVFLWNFGCFFVAWFVGQFAWDGWKLGLRGITAYVVLVWLAQSLGFALFCGFFIALGTWLTQEILGSSKNDSSRGAGAQQIVGRERRGRVL